MGSKDGIPKIAAYKGSIPNIKPNEINYMKIVEKANLERVQKLKKVKKNNIITASVLGATVVGIYVYSMVAVKQERFLDDFDEPEKIQIAK